MPRDCLEIQSVSPSRLIDKNYTTTPAFHLNFHIRLRRQHICSVKIGMYVFRDLRGSNSSRDKECDWSTSAAHRLDEHIGQRHHSLMTVTSLASTEIITPLSYFSS